MMHFEEQGNPKHPTLVLVPGLFGGPTDFAAVRLSWIDAFHVITLDPDNEKRKMCVSSLNDQAVQNELYRSTTDSIHEILQSLGKSSAYLVGNSLGSKIVYDFAIKYPEMFAGGLSLDTGPGPFEGSSLSTFVEDMVDRLDLTIPFVEMKKLLREKIVDRNLRAMIQTQIFYPNGKPPARWKTGIHHLSTLLTHTLRVLGIEEQFDELARVDDFLADTGRYIHVLLATDTSAIRPEHLERMQSFRSLKIAEVKNASHFMLVTKKDLIAETVLSLAHPVERLHGLSWVSRREEEASAES